MASIIPRKNSPHLHIKYKSDGKWKTRATKYLKSSFEDRREARREVYRLTQQEMEITGGGPREHFNSWVPMWIQDRYAKSAKTESRYGLAWRNLSTFLDERKIKSPAQLNREACFDYLRWRKDHENSALSPCGHNTALFELKFLRVIMFEAVDRRIIQTNPCSRLKIEKEASKEKRPLDDQEILFIYKKLAEQPEWMMVSMEFGLYQASRISQTSTPIDGIDWKRGIITYHRERVKGGQAFSHPIDERFIPRLKTITAKSKDGLTCTLPSLASLIWWKFLKRIGIKDASHHCFRVTWVTRACLNEVPEAFAMKFVHHGSSDVHRIYQKLKAEDLKHVPSRVSLPSLGTR